MTVVHGVPEGWLNVTLGECTSQMSSGLSRKLESADIGLPVIRSGNVGEKYVSFDDLRYWYVDDPQGANTANYVLDDDDILVNFINSVAQIGKACIFRNSLGRDIIYTTNLLRLKANTRIIPYYLFLVTKTREYDWYVQSITKPAVNQASFTTAEFKKFSFPLPPLEEQRKIADILNTWDEAIEQQTRLLELKRERKRGLMQQLLTGKVRFEEFEGLEWGTKMLGSLCSIQTGKKDVNQGNPNGKFPFFTCAKESTFSDTYTYDMEAIMIAGNGAIGTSHYYKGKFEAYQRTYILSSFSSLINVRFLLEWIRYDFVNTVLGFKQESAMPYIRLPTLRDFSVPLPSLPEQQKIAAVLSATDAELETLGAQLAALRTQKRGLMQQLLTGKTRVKIA